MSSFREAAENGSNACCCAVFAIHSHDDCIVGFRIIYNPFTILQSSEMRNPSTSILRKCRSAQFCAVQGIPGFGESTAPKMDWLNATNLGLVDYSTQNWGQLQLESVRQTHFRAYLNVLTFGGVLLQAFLLSATADDFPDIDTIFGFNPRRRFP